MTFFGAERFSEKKKWSITAEYFSEEIKATRTLKLSRYPCSFGLVHCVTPNLVNSPDNSYGVSSEQLACSCINSDWEWSRA